MKNILVFIENSEGTIRKASFEAVSQSYKLKESLGVNLIGVSVNCNDDELQALGRYGLEKIYNFNAKNLKFNSAKAIANILSETITKNSIDLILLSATSLGKEISSILSAKHCSAVASDCIGLELKDNELLITRPIYAGKILSTIKLNSDIKILTLRPNIFEAEELPESLSVNITTIAYEVPSLKTVIKEIISGETDEVSLTEADVIVAGGRGVKSPENYELLRQLADVLGGCALGASRSAVDAGWIDHCHQVGQTGKVVAPKLYIACGISGAIQHLAGMSSSKCIVAINKDPDAPIFNVADYGIVGDLFEIIPALIEEIKKIKS